MSDGLMPLKGVTLAHAGTELRFACDHRRWFSEDDLTDVAFPVRVVSRLSYGHSSAAPLARVLERHGKLRELTADDIRRARRSVLFEDQPRIGSERTARRVWRAVRDRAGATRARPYTPRDIFEVDDVVDHSKFGIGFVYEVRQENTIEVVFSCGLKRLAHRR